MPSAEASITLVGGFATIGIFSFLVRENKLYRFFEHLFIGISAGLLPILTVKNLLWPSVIEPMLGLNLRYFPDGTVVTPYNPWYLLYLFPMAFGSLYYTLYSRKYSWLAKLVIALTLGAGAGVAFKGFFNEMLPQIVNSFKPLAVFEDGSLLIGKSLSNILFVVTLLTVMYYFFFSFRERAGTSRIINPLGRCLMMVCFGAFFGSTVMARLALLVERIQFLIDDWWPTLWSLGGGA